jgi:hypothetical protein
MSRYPKSESAIRSIGLARVRSCICGIIGVVKRAESNIHA